MDISTLFGIAVAATLLLTWASGFHIFQKVGLLLMLAWAVSNVAVDYMGFPRAPLLIPSLDGLVGILIAMVGFQAKSKTALAIVVLYAIVSVVHVIALVLRMQETYTYYAALNILFLAQLLVLGGSSGRLAVRNWSASRDQRHGAGFPRPQNTG